MSNHEARADAGSILRHRPLTYRIVKEICNAAGELARFPAPFTSRVLKNIDFGAFWLRDGRYCSGGQVL